FSSRCLIYKVHAALSGRSFSISYLVLAVKHFFHFFSPAFPPASMIQRSHSAHPPQPFQLAANFYMIPLFARLVKRFFYFLFRRASRLVFRKLLPLNGLPRQALN
ncbi:hypothetical protein, partial [Pseudoflavonifractor phocaeensis]|uniref:hypothetical protein n=1 Tax=Pseudoflavonifractor phocaeensis TaxID=1870988 RepID=UPI002108AA9F